MAKKKPKKKDNIAEYFIPAGLFIGIGIGLAVGQVAAGCFNRIRMWIYRPHTSKSF